jgi:hypothetical protein
MGGLALPTGAGYGPIMREVVVAIGISALIAGCGGSGAKSHPSSTASPQASRAAASATCITKQGFGGLGGRRDRFDANNNNTTGEAGPTPGAAFFQVDGTLRGCVTAYEVLDSAAPPLRAGDMLDLVSSGHLPRDAEPIVSTNSCAVWKSFELRRAVGLLYARATAIGQLEGAPGTAVIQATSHSTC